MNIDNLHRRVYSNIVRPGLTPGRPVGAAADSTTAHAPMLQRYHSGSDSLMYLWMWSSFMHSNNVYCHDATIVSESGVPAFSVGEEGFNAGESAALDPEAPFQAPDCPIEAVDGVGGEVSAGTDFGILGSEAGDATRSGWFDSFDFGGDSSGHDSGGGDVGGGGSGCGSACGGGGCGS